jgi:hypothetical protein
MWMAKHSSMLESMNGLWHNKMVTDLDSYKSQEATANLCKSVVLKFVLLTEVNLKGQLSREQARRAQTGSGAIALLFLQPLR